MRNTLILIAAAALALTGCASAGTNFDPAAAAAITPGMTKQEVLARLGQPNSIATGVDGRQVMVWSHANVNGFTGSVQSRAVSFVFGPDGRVAGPTSTSQIQGKSGL